MNDRIYRNKFERLTAEQLTDKSVEFSYEAERIRYTVEGNYIPDFKIRTATGKTIYVETKGNGRSFDGQARRKLRAVQEQHPDIDLRIVFYTDGKCGPKRKDGTYMRQSDWAKKHGFRFSIGTIPESWLSE